MVRLPRMRMSARTPVRTELEHESEWAVKVVITAIDESCGRLWGVMEAEGIRRPANATRPGGTVVVTAWKGEVIDVKTEDALWTGEWASRKVDEEYWAKTEAFRSVPPHLIAVTLRDPGFLAGLRRDFILMRWKGLQAF